MKFTKNDNYPSPNSAQGKALNRLRDLDNPYQWVVAVCREEEIDLKDLDEKIRKSGYLDSINSDSTDEEMQELSELIEDHCLGYKALASKKESGFMGSDNFTAELERFNETQVPPAS